MEGILFSILAGILISLQGVFNNRVSDRIGMWEATAVVHGIGFAFALLILTFWSSGNIKKIGEVNKLYLLGGALGVIIVYSVIKGIGLLGPAYSTAILLIVQLIAAVIIDTFGLFGCQKIKFDYTKPLGILVMIVGIIIFKLKG
jgi:Uncharacterized protein conserved in bacteria